MVLIVEILQFIGGEQGDSRNFANNSMRGLNLYGSKNEMDKPPITTDWGANIMKYCGSQEIMGMQ